jgi:photosystem II stability/assembly factor-like uncharacterized protein
LNLPAEQKIAVGQELKFQITASDVDVSDLLAITASNLPAGAALNPAPAPQGAAAQFIWTPTQAQIGTSIVVFRVADNGAPQQSIERPLAITVTAADAPPVAGIWNSTAGPAGGAINAFFSRGTTVLAASPVGGVFRSTNGGETWSPLPSTTFDGRPVGAFASTGSTLLANTGLGFYRSTDDGVTWTRSLPQLETTSLLLTLPIATALSVKGPLVIGTYINRLFVSYNGGLNWTASATGLPASSPVLSLATSGGSIFAFVDGRSVYRSDDDGKTWVSSSQGLPDPFFLDGALFPNGNVIYALLSDRDDIGTTASVYSSIDNGRNWTVVNLPTETYPVRQMIFTADQWLISTPRKIFSLTRQANQSITATQLLETPFVNALAASETSLFAGTLLDGVFRSTDKGANWRRSNTGLSAMRVNGVHSAGSNLFAATTAGMFVSPDQGQTWQSANTGFATALSLDSIVDYAFVSPIEIMAFASIPAADRTYLFAAQRNSSLYRSTDLGKTWERVGGLPPLAKVAVLGVNGTVLFAGMGFLGLPLGEGPVYRSTDFGKSWASTSNGLSSGDFMDFASLGSNIFFATSNQVYRSANNGESWQSASGGLPAATPVTALAAGGTNLYVGTFGKGVYVSPNNGQSWAALNANLPKDAAIRGLLADGSNLFVISPTEYDTLCPTGGIFIDGRCFGALLPGSISRFDFDLFFGTLGPGKIYFSPNQGQSWAPILSGLKETPITAIGAGGGIVFAGSIGGGVFLRRF